MSAEHKPHSGRYPEGLEVLRGLLAEPTEEIVQAIVEDPTLLLYVGDLIEQFDAWADCMNYAWTIICNVSEGDWTKQSTEWHKAAARCRDQYHALLSSERATSAAVSDPEEPLGETVGERQGRQPAPESSPASSLADGLCHCGGYEAGRHHFSRTICACGTMHYYCDDCSCQGDPCDSNQDSEPKGDA